jgi:hypothetical protein
MLMLCSCSGAYLPWCYAVFPAVVVPCSLLAAVLVSCYAHALLLTFPQCHVVYLIVFPCSCSVAYHPLLKNLLLIKNVSCSVHVLLLTIGGALGFALSFFLLLFHALVLAFFRDVWCIPVHGIACLPHIMRVHSKCSITCLQCAMLFHHATSINCIC